jgi:hypothetical protein
MFRQVIIIIWGVVVSLEATQAVCIVDVLYMDYDPSRVVSVEECNQVWTKYGQKYVLQNSLNVL